MRCLACGQKLWRRAHVRKGRRSAQHGSVKLGSGLDTRVLRTSASSEAELSAAATVPKLLQIQREAMAAGAGRVLLALALLVAVGFVALLIAVSRASGSNTLQAFCFVVLLSLCKPPPLSKLHPPRQPPHARAGAMVLREAFLGSRSIPKDIGV